MNQKRKIDGWVFLDKPIGMTSNSALQKVRKIFQRCKAGYLGTLDPLATGFLPIALGNATKTIRLLEEMEKKYIFTLKWGVKTSTGDIEGEVEKKTNKFPDTKSINVNVKKFIGQIMQLPPKFSSIKVNGIRAYKLARKKEKFSLLKRKVSIKKFFLSRKISSDKSEFFVQCGSGTYIRSLAEDLARSLGTYGTVLSLRRVGFVNCNKKLISLDYLLTLMHSGKLINSVEPVSCFFDGMREINLRKDQVGLILNGRPVEMDHNFEKKNNEVVFAKFANQIIAFGYLLEKFFYPKRLLRDVNEF